MAKSVFSVPIFFILFRETLEAAIIVSVLLSLVEQIVYEDKPPSETTTLAAISVDDDKREGEQPVQSEPELESSEEHALRLKRLIRKMRWQIFLGSGLGLFIALAIGAAFIAVWFTKASDLWAKSEQLWEAIFQLIACIIIFVMGVTMLKMDRAKAKWRVKLQRAFEGKHVDGEGRSGKWALFFLPFITVLREGMEAVVFVGGVSLGQSATAIPLAAVVGIICGLICGYLIYAFASRTALTAFLVVMTNLILLIGAGLFSKSIEAFQKNEFYHLLGADVGDSSAVGNGPGSYDVRGNVWHLDCCNPYNYFDSQGWTIFNAIFGWTNSATIGTVLGYVFYWLAVIVALIYLKWKEGRTMLFGKESAAGARRRQRAALVRGDSEASIGKDSDEEKA